MPVYSYKSLNPQIETRPFTIVTGEYEDDLICSISHICLESPLEYEALSYVWANSLCNRRRRPWLRNQSLDLCKRKIEWIYWDALVTGYHRPYHLSIPVPRHRLPQIPWAHPLRWGWSDYRRWTVHRAEAIALVQADLQRGRTTDALGGCSMHQPKWHERAQKAC